MSASHIRIVLAARPGVLRTLLCLSLLLGTASAFGQGYPFTSADGRENWDHDFDTSKLPAGTYHIVVEGKDNAGNSGLASSINVYIDPASALPVVSIINPTSLQRVGGDLTVVGTCAADAGVSRVEVRIDGGPYQPAQGGEFWSLSIPTKDLPEGRKTLEVRGIDSAGLAGKPVKVVFILDHTEPASSVDFPPPGSLVAGAIRLRGTAFSMNGIASLEASIDGGKSFRNVSIERGKLPGKVSFAVDIDTRKLPDGPRILWLRSVDQAGLKGSATFLIFVSNTKPKIDVRWPAPGDVVHGRFSIAGSVRSAIGVAKLGYELEGGKKGEIALTPGDPYFVQQLDAREMKGDKANIVVVAQDRIGNITRQAVSVKIDHGAERPVVKVIFPSPAGKLGPGDLIWGSITADDGGAGIRVAVDGGAPKELPASDVFSFSLPNDLASGKHTLTVQAKDAYGTWGIPVSLPVTIDGGPAAIRFLSVGSQTYFPGAAFRVDGGSWLSGTIRSPNGLARIAFSVAGGPERALAPAKGSGNGAFDFRVPLDRSLPYGFVPIEVRGVDASGRTFAGKALLYSVDLSSDREDAGFRFDDPRIGAGGRVKLASGDPLLGAFYREEIDSLRLDPPSNLVSLSFQGTTVRVEAAGEGVTPPERIVARTKRGHEFSSDTFVFDCGAAPPAQLRITGVSVSMGKTVSLWKPGADMTLASGASLKGSLVGAGAKVIVEYRINGGQPQKASLGKPEGTGTPFTCPLPSSLPYERFVVEVSAREGAGPQTVRRYDFHNILPPLAGAPATDAADAIRFFDDRISDVAGGRLIQLGSEEQLVGAWNGRPLKSISVLPPTPLLEAGFEGGRITLSAAKEGVAKTPDFRVRAETVDGDVFEWGPFGIVTRSGPPRLTLKLPVSDAWVRGSVEVAGTAEASSGIASVEASVNGGPFVTVPEAAVPSTPPAAGPRPFAFDSTLPLEAVSDGAARIDVRVRDVSGAETVGTRFFTKDTVAPSVRQVYPLEGDEVTGPTTIVGAARDAGHVASVQFLPSKDGTPQETTGMPTFSATLDLARLPYPLPPGGGFLVVDRAGNSTLFVPTLQVNAEMGKPVVQILAPAETEIIRSDFSISGTAFDRAGVSRVYYRIDNSDWKSIELKDAGFSIPIALASTTDNEHLFEAYAENIYGTKGDIASRKYRISKEEPRAVMSAPDIAKPVRGVIDISGTASDANGVDSVSLSFDNGASYVTAAGAETWHYTLDTRILKDGLHPITVKPVDGYGTVGFAASLITVDNTPPDVQLASPKDGDVASGSIDVSGRVSDKSMLASVRVELIPIGQARPPAFTADLGQTEVVRSRLDVSNLPAGAYTLRLIGRDRADNEAFVSRDLTLSKDRPAEKVEIYYPVDGQKLSGRLRIYGRAVIAGGASSVTLLSDGVDVGSAPLDPLGFFALDVPADRLSDGSHALSARGVGSGNTVVESRAATVSWQAEGPWVLVDSLPLGRYLPERPWLSGTAGWTVRPFDPKDAAAAAADRKAAPGRKVEKVEVSLDNGRSYRRAGGNEHWRFRLETQRFPEGSVFVLVRATFRDGSVVVTKTIFSLDRTPPAVRILAPPENSRFRSHVLVAGTASDESSGLASVAVALRPGDKHSGEVPAFIQGLYADAHVLGATTWETGLGLSFFNDNVKLQATYGQAPDTDANGDPQRFFGNVFSAKLIANVFYMPFSWFLGPDWDFLAVTLSLGAEFSYFDMNGTGGKGLSAVIAQVELPKLTRRNASYLSKVSLYVEEEAWFVPSDVPDASTVLFRTTFGVRVGIF